MLSARYCNGDAALRAQGTHGEIDDMAADRCPGQHSQLQHLQSRRGCFAKRMLSVLRVCQASQKPSRHGKLLKACLSSPLSLWPAHTKECIPRARQRPIPTFSSAWNGGVAGYSSSFSQPSATPLSTNGSGVGLGVFDTFQSQGTRSEDFLSKRLTMQNSEARCAAR